LTAWLLAPFLAPKRLAAALAENAELKKRLAESITVSKMGLPVETIHTISFDYLPLSPLENGWVQAYNADGAAKFGSDPDIPGSLRMKILKSEVAIEHNMPPHAMLADHFKFTAKYTNSANRTMIFTRLTVGTKDGSNLKMVDIKHCYGELRSEPTVPNPSPGRDFNKWLSEQTLYWPAEVLSGGRLEFNIDLQGAVNLSLGSQGWEFKSIESVRLRGNLSISPLVLGKTRQI